MKRKSRLFILGVLVLSVTVLTIGYAALSSTLTINGVVDVNPAEWDVAFTNLSTVSLEKGALVNTPATITNNKHTLTFDITLTAPGDKVSYNVDLENLGDLDAEITDISITNSAVDNDLEFEFFYTDSLANVSLNDVVEKHTKKNTTLSIGIPMSATQVTAENVTITVEIEYSQILK